jgi:hypothetical protein
MIEKFQFHCYVYGIDGIDCFDPRSPENSTQFHVGDDEEGFSSAEVAYNEAMFWAQRDADRYDTVMTVYGMALDSDDLIALDQCVPNPENQERYH